MKGGGDSTTQTQTNSQNTQVTVQNVIEAPQLDPLQKLSLLADVFAKLDSADAAKNKAPETVLSIANIPASQFLTDPKFIVLVTAAAAGLILLNKKI